MSKMKVLNVLVVIALIMSFLFSGSPSTATATPLAHEVETATGGTTSTTPARPTATLPLIADFESGGVGTWFTYGDAGSSIVKNVVLTNTLSTVGVVSNTVMQVDYVSAGWGVGVGLDTVPFQDWSTYDGFEFWFYGSNNGAVFKIIVTDNGGERVSTQFTDNFSGWKQLQFPWQVFSHDNGYQPGGSPDDGPTLTAVEAFAFAPTSPSSGTYFMDQIKLFKNTIAVVADFQTGDVAAWFTYGDAGSSIVKNVVLTNTLSTLGVVSNTVMQVDYVSAGWGVGVGKDTIPFQDWSGADGLSFWFDGSNSGTVFNILLTDNGGERISTQFTDNFSGWKQLQFPWQVFSHDGGYQPGGAPNDGPTLTAVEAFAFAPTSPSSGTYFMDQIKLFKNTIAVVADFQTGDVAAWFTYGDAGSSIVKNVVLTNTLSTLGVVSNTVMQVDYVSAGWGVGVGKDTIPFQDWSGADGLSFWFDGSNSGTVVNILLTDNGGERISTLFTDNFSGWKQLQFPWQVFSHDGGYQPGGAPNDGPTLTAVEAFAFAPLSPSSGTYFMDQIKLFGSATSTALPKAGFPSATYNVSEGAGSAQIPVQLNATSATTVTVDYATVGGTATPNVDYTPISGTLSFAPGATVLTVTVPITDDVVFELSETIVLSLTGASNATIGSNNPTTINIINNDTQPGSLMLFDFEAGMPSGYFADPGGNISANVVTDNALSQLGVSTNHVLAVSVTTPRAWAGLQGFNISPAQNWSTYDGVSFWFKGTNSGKTFLYVITQDGGAGLYQAPFVDNSAGWKYVSLPWETFKYREGASGTPTLSLTSVSAYFIQLSDNGGDTGFSGTFSIDQMKLFDNSIADVFDFEAGMPGGGFADPGGQIASSIVTTDTLAQFGVSNNHVLAVSVTTPRAWAGLQGFNISPAQDWSTHNGVSFWFKGTNSGKTFLYAITQGGGAGLYQASFVDNTAGWKLVSLPWQAFSYREGATGTPTFSLTSVTAYFIQFSDNGGDTGFSGTFYVDQMKLFDTAPTNVYDYESGLPSVYFADPGGQIAANVVATNTLSQLGVITNHVLAVNVIAPRAWAGLQGFNVSPAQDWSAYDGVSFWFKGTSSGKTFLYAITQGGGAGLYQASFKDNTTGWKLVNLPWQAFTYREGATGTPILSLTSVTAYFIQFSDNGGDTGFTGTFYLDQMAVYGPTGTFYIDQIASAFNPSAPAWRPSKVAFASASYAVSENAGSAVIDVVLDTASTVPVTVSYATQGGTATPNVDYTPVSGSLVFAPAVTVMTFTVPITDNVQYNIFKTVGLSLTNVISGELGAINPATLIINDNDSPNSLLIDNFESGLTTGKDIFNNQIGYSTFGSTQGNVAITVTSGMTYTGGSLPNSVLKVTSNIENWGGFTNAFPRSNTWSHQDWSRYDGLRFWFYGTNSGKQIQVEIFDNRQLENTGDSAERYYQRFPDNFSGWQQISLPFALFQRRTDFQPGGAPADGLNLTDVSGYAFNLPSVSATTIYYIDQVEVYGDLSAHPATTRVGFSAYAYGTIEGQPLVAEVMLNTPATSPITATYAIATDTATSLDFTGPLTGTVVFAVGEQYETITVQTIDDSKVEPREQLKISLTNAVGAPIGYVSRALLVIIDNDIPDPKVIDDFEAGVPIGLQTTGNVTVTAKTVLATDPLAVPGQNPDNTILDVSYNLAAGTSGGFTREIDPPQDFSQSDGVSFWFNGTGSGKTVTFTLLDNNVTNTVPADWTLAWSDEFSGTNGAAPNPANWGYDLGGGGWGNNEWQYYTDSRDNSALDGSGNLVISAKANTNPAYTCTSSSPTGPGGPCYATSARLLSAGKQEFAFGRVEARLQIPKGQGIWPAFWMLGNDIFTTNPWPASGEIDIMENIGKPSEQGKVYGTIHGPGYSGGSGIGGSRDVTPTVLADNFHVYAIEWEPTAIRWYLDGYNYFTATKSMIPVGTQWVFEHPFFIIMNIAVGGNWPGYPDGTTVMPQTMKVDYVRVYQAPDTAERFETTFVDTATGWRKIVLPYSGFTRSATQPAGAPNDGLTLTQAHGYGLELSVPAGSFNRPTATGTVHLDQVKLASNILTVALAGNGAGTIDPAAGIYTYDTATTAWLTATANTGSVFTGWSGSVTGSANSVSVTVTGTVAVTATFALNTYTLTVATDGNGTGAVTPTVGEHPYLYGDVVTLTASANAGSSFAGWSGAASDVLTSTQVTMTENKAVTATFALKTYTLTVATDGNGTGAVTPTVGEHPYLYGDIVTLTASANAGSSFAGWSGAASGVLTSTQLTMTGNKAVTATFSLDCISITGTDFTFAPNAPKVGQPVTFNGSITAGTTPISYTWAFGDGNVGSGAAITHTFPLTTLMQTYTVTLSATNACSALAATPRLVTVSPYRVNLPIVRR